MEPFQKYMNTQELMYGDCVLYSGVPTKVDAKILQANAMFVEPIYLTRKHIIDNGFVEADTFAKNIRIYSLFDSHWRTFYLTDHNCINGGLDWVLLRDGKVIIVTNFRYVHELQHAMRLMSMQETANEFNVKF